MSTRKPVRVRAGDALQFAEDYKLECQEKLRNIDVAVAAAVCEAEGKFKPSWFARLFRIKPCLTFNRDRALHNAESEHEYQKYWLERRIKDMTSLRYEALYYLKDGFTDMELDGDYADRFFKRMAENNIS